LIGCALFAAAQLTVKITLLLLQFCLTNLLNKQKKLFTFIFLQDHRKCEIQAGKMKTVENKLSAL